MRYHRTLIIVASAALCGWPLQVVAQSDSGFSLEEAPAEAPVDIKTSSVELGVGWVSEDSYKFGEYTGLDEKGIFVIGNIDFLWRAPYDGDSTQYWKVDGSNLGLDSRSVHLEAGQQGQFKFYLDYRQLPHFSTDDAVTPYIGAGTDQLILPDDWVSASDAPALPQLDADERPVKLKTERKRFGGGFTYSIDDNWSFGGSFMREEKNGIDSITGIIRRSALLPKPIDYTTEDAQVFLAYNGDKFQMEASYHLSLFDDHNLSLTWQNAYDSSSNACPQDFDCFTGIPGDGGYGRLALEPDNSMHAVSVAMGYTLDPTTRLAGSFSYMRMFQDDTFLPYGVEFLTQSALPRTGLGGDVTKIHGAMSVAKQFTPDLTVNAQYVYDDRDNNTPRALYCPISADGSDQNTECDDPGDSLVTDAWRINVPLSRTQHDFNVDAIYRLMPSTKVQLGYGFEAISRDVSEVDDTYEHTGTIKLMSRPFDFASGWVKYSFSQRTGSHYTPDAPLIATFTPEYIDSLGADPEVEGGENPDLRKYFLADRRRHRLSGAVNLMPMDQLTIGLMGSIDLSDYYNSELGLQNRDFANATLDLTYMPMEEVALHAFFTYDWMKNKQRGFGSGPSGSATDYWTIDTRDNGYTVGVGADWSVIPDKLSVGVDYTYSYTTTSYGFDSVVTNAPVPDVTSSLHSLGAHADYRLAEDAVLSLFYQYETYNNNDFAMETGTSLPQLITLGTQDLDYTEHVVGVSLRYSF